MTAILAATGLGFLALPATCRKLGRRLDPRRWAALCVAALLGGTALVVGAGLLASLSTVLRAVGLSRMADACDVVLRPFASAGPPLALAALAMTLSVVASCVHALRSSRATAMRLWVEDGVGARMAWTGTFDVVVLDDSRPRALSVPGTSGRPGQILLSTGLLKTLTPSEIDLVCAHEEAHLRMAHHRYLVLGMAVERSMWFWPPAKRGVAILRLALERWADEEATAESSSARARLQTALLVVAIDREHSALAAFSSVSGLVERLTAMGEPPRGSTPLRWLPMLTLLPGVLLGALAVFSLAQMWHGSCCLLSTAPGCHLP